MALAFTTICLIPKDGKLPHNAHFIEIIVLIMALRIHHFVSIVKSCMGTLHTEMWSEHLVSE